MYHLKQPSWNSFGRLFTELSRIQPEPPTWDRVTRSNQVEPGISGSSTPMMKTTARMSSRNVPSSFWNHLPTISSLSALEMYSNEMTCFSVVWTKSAYGDKCSIWLSLRRSFQFSCRKVRTHWKWKEILPDILQESAANLSFLASYKKSICADQVEGHFAYLYLWPICNNLKAFNLTKSYFSVTFSLQLPS